MTLRTLPPLDIGEPQYKQILLSGKRPQFHAQVMCGYHICMYVRFLLHVFATVSQCHCVLCPLSPCCPLTLSISCPCHSIPCPLHSVLCSLRFFLHCNLFFTATDLCTVYSDPAHYVLCRTQAILHCSSKSLKIAGSRSTISGPRLRTSTALSERSLVSALPRIRRPQ